MSVERLLVATDQSETARRAVEWAADLARCTHAQTDPRARARPGQPHPAVAEAEFADRHLIPSRHWHRGRLVPWAQAASDPPDAEGPQRGPRLPPPHVSACRSARWPAA